MNAEQVRLLHGRRARGARASVEQCDLPEELTRLQHVEHDLASLRRGGVDPHPPRQNAIEAVARVAFAEDLPVRLEPGDRREFHEVIERPLRHRRNQKVLR